MWLALAGLLLAAVPAAAQDPDPVGPYVIDVRGATSGLPNETSFFPGLPLDTLVPARGYGFDVGGHVYLVTLGPSRIGIGASYLRARGTAGGVAAVLSAVAPQVSFNFGTRDGWSYLSGGVGRVWVRTTLEGAAGQPFADLGGLTAANVGGGARWFLTSRVAVGFDLRWHRVSGPPRTTLLAVSVGFSLR